MDLYTLIKPLLFSLTPEMAHKASLEALRLFPFYNKKLVSKTSRKIMELDFPNPVGLAAGLDKNADYIDVLAKLGFGFIEVGTVTPTPQQGNPKPRIFRIPKKNALINRLGFNNKGVDYLVNQLKQKRFNGIVGVSITQNNATPFEKANEDYLFCFEKVYPYASYICADVSCPNVVGQTSLSQPELFSALLTELKQKQSQLTSEQKRYVPLVIKISPDLTTEEIAVTANILLKHQVDGVIACNTTKKRPMIENLAIAKERGGLSGTPVFDLTLHTIQQLHFHLQNKIPIIGVGGIMSVENAQAFMSAGASLVQIYTGLIYQGPGFVEDLVRHL
ncbi:MAG: quinone-dependent dihydroorotate dehydrogenase [Gammaproteobacteria bacterium]